MEDKSDILLCFLEMQLVFSVSKPFEKNKLSKGHPLLSPPFLPPYPVVLMPVDDKTCF